jgi:G1/S-specific cyclin PLC1
MAYSARALNEAALDNFIYMPVSSQMISYLATKASEVIQCEPVAPQAKHLPPTPPQAPHDDASIPSLERFITSLVKKSNVQVPTLMTSLVYLARLKSRLPPVAKGLRCTVHRIFLAALILSAKNLNDSSPKNKHWAEYSNVRGYEPFGFSRTEVNLMEKQLLFLLDWDLNITTDDLYTHFEPFLAPIRVELQRQEERARARESRKAAAAAKAARALEEEVCKPQAAYYNVQNGFEYYDDGSYIDPTGTVVRPYTESPPPSSEVPELSHSSSELPSSSASSYTSRSSRSGTPASSLFDDQEMSVCYGNEGLPRSDSYSPNVVRDVVHVQIQSAHKMLPYEIERELEDKPKRSRGNLFSRFLNGQRTAY